MYLASTDKELAEKQAGVHAACKDLVCRFAALPWWRRTASRSDELHAQILQQWASFGGWTTTHIATKREAQTTTHDQDCCGNVNARHGCDCGAGEKKHLFRQGTWKCGSCGENRGALQDRCICGRQRGPWTS